MRLPTPARIAFFVTLCSATLGLFACSSSQKDPSPPATPSTVATSTVPPVALDWSAPEKAQLPDGWSLSGCTGDAPLICVSRGGRPVGQMEKLALELSTLPDLARVLSEKGAVAALDDHAHRFVADFTADRAVGCGSSYTVTPHPSVRLSTPDGQALRYGFTGTLAGGTPSEVVAHYATVTDGRLVLLVANASDPGGCLPEDEGTPFTSAELRAFLPLLDQLVSSSGVPTP